MGMKKSKIKRFRKVLSLLLTAALAGSLLPDPGSTGSVQAAGEIHDNHPACGTACHHDGSHEDITDWKALTISKGKLLADGISCTSAAGITILPAGNYYLPEDVSVPVAGLGILIYDGAVNLCLHGKTMDLNGENIEVDTNQSADSPASLTICDCIGNGIVTSDVARLTSTATIMVYAAEFYMYSGKVINTSPGSEEGYGYAVSSLSFARRSSVNIFGGEMISSGSSAINIRINGMTLSGSPVIRGAADCADIICHVSRSDPPLIIDSLQGDNAPYRLGVGGEGMLTSGWAESMGGQDFNQYFKIITEGYLIDKNEAGELVSREGEATEEPSDENHTMTPVRGKAATCMDEGNSAYYICSVCDKWFADEAGSQEITDKESVVIPALGHDFSGSWESDGARHWHSCTRCDESSGEDVHSFREWTVDRAPTEKEPGVRHRDCTICQYREAQEIPGTGDGISEGGNASGSGISGDGSVSGSGISGDGSVSGGGISLPGNGGIVSKYQKENDSDGDDTGTAKKWKKNNSGSGSDGDSPETGDRTPIRLWATIAMFSWLLLYFTGRRRRMIEERKKEMVSRIIEWARRDGRSRKLLAVAAIFVVLVYYHSIGKPVKIAAKSPN